MCGIAGYLGAQPLPEGIEARWLQALGHRGPDDRGQLRDAGVWLGQTRLSIIDLSVHAHQPMTDPSGRYSIVYNGEVYNYRELREELAGDGIVFTSSSDTEVILLGYAHWGEAIVDKLRGMFAFCIHDRERGSLFLARDRFGIKPLLYAQPEGAFAFSSELSALRALPQVGRRLDWTAIGDCMTYGAVRQPRTIYEGIRHLPAGHCMIVDRDRRFSIWSYYRLADAQSQIPDSYPEAVEALRQRLEEATRYHMIADVTVGAFLSGGVDSSAVVALMARQVDQPIKTFSVGFHAQGEVIDESSQARTVAQALGTDHHEVILNPEDMQQIFEAFIGALDQPSVDGINSFVVSREASRHVKVALSGLGGDEIFGGYPHFRLIQAATGRRLNLWWRLQQSVDAIRSNRFTRGSRIVGRTPESAMDSLRRLNERIREAVPQARGAQEENEPYPVEGTIRRVSLSEIENYMRNTLLRDADVMSMASSLELRPVLLDHPLVEFALGLPDHYKVNAAGLKRIFVDSVRDLIPPVCWQTEKRGFEMPFCTWMNGPLRKGFGALVAGDIGRVVLGEAFRRKLLGRIEHQKLRRSDWMYLVLLAWMQKNVPEIAAEGC